jgi:TolA-binding protein
VKLPHLVCTAGALLAVLAPPAGAQDALETVERLADSGRFTDARTTLDRWNADHPPAERVPASTRAHALLLAARLTVDPTAAEETYQAVALSYPTTAYAPEALLRLGQGLVALAATGQRRGAADRAVQFLERLVRDYPGNEHRGSAWLWLVRAHALAGNTQRACTAARKAIGDGMTSEDMHDMLLVEQSIACDA